MPHKTIHHVLTHQAGETSLAGCLAARDNKLRVKGERRLCPSVSLQYVYIDVCVTGSMCECEEKWGTESLGAMQHCTERSLFSSEYFLKVLLWPFPVLRGGTLICACGALQFWVQWHILNGGWEEPVFCGQMIFCSEQCTFAFWCHRKKLSLSIWMAQKLLHKTCKTLNGKICAVIMISLFCTWCTENKEHKSTVREL